MQTLPTINLHISENYSCRQRQNKINQKIKHCKNCERCPTQVPWKVKFKCQSCFSCVFCVSCLSRLSLFCLSSLSSLTYLWYFSPGSCQMTPQMTCLTSLNGQFVIGNWRLYTSKSEVVSNLPIQVCWIRSYLTRCAYIAASITLNCKQ